MMNYKRDAIKEAVEQLIIAADNLGRQEAYFDEYPQDKKALDGLNEAGIAVMEKKAELLSILDIED